MNKILCLTAAIAFATAPAFAGSLAGATDDADPFVAAGAPSSSISPLLIGLGAAGIIAAVVLLSDSNSSTTGTTTRLVN